MKKEGTVTRRYNGGGEITNQLVLEFLELCERVLPFLVDPGQPGLFLGDRLAEGAVIRHRAGVSLQCLNYVTRRGRASV